MTSIKNPTRVIPTAGTNTTPQCHGTYQGSVVNINDPLKLNRVQALVPQILGTAVSNWAIPEGVSSGVVVGQSIFVSFIGGDRNRPTYSVAYAGTTPTGLFGFWAPPGLDPSGASDSDAAINNALSLASPGQVVQLPPSNPNAGYTTIAPILIPNGVYLKGPQSATQSGNNAGSDWGAVIKPASVWSAGSLSIAGAISFNGTARGGICDLWVDGTNGPSTMDLIAATGANACRISGVGLYNGPHRGISAVNGPIGFTDGWTVENVILQIMQQDGVYGRYSDTTFSNVHSQSCGQSGTGDAWFIQGGGNLRLNGCRADLSQNGFTFDVAPSSGYYDPVMLTNCGTQRNQQMGLRAVNFSSSPLSNPRVAVKVNGGSFDGDGVNSGAGGGGFAGLMAYGMVTLILDGVNVQVMTLDVASGCPQYALTTRVNNSEPPQLVQAVGGLWNSASSTLVNDAAPARLMSYSVHGYVGGVYSGTPSTPASLMQLNPA